MLDVTIFERCKRLLWTWGVADDASAMVLYGMVTAGIGYGESCRLYGEYQDTDENWIHSGISCNLLAAGCNVMPGTLFRYLAWRVVEEGEN